MGCNITKTQIICGVYGGKYVSQEMGKETCFEVRLRACLYHTPVY